MTDDPGRRPDDPDDSGAYDRDDDTSPLMRLFGRQERDEPPTHPLPDEAAGSYGRAEPSPYQPSGGAWGQPGQPGQAGQPGHAGQLSGQPPGPAYAPFGQPPFGSPAYGPPAGSVPPTDRPDRLDDRRARPAGWVWPAVAALALVVGLLGGVGGALLVGADDSGGPVPAGVGGVDTETAPPVAAGNQSVAAVAEKLLPSTVQIIADADGQPLAATGSGWVFDRQGHVITNNHVIAGSAESGNIVVVDREGTRSKATLVGRSTVYDLAVLEVAGAKRLQPVSLGRSASLRVGDPVVAIGSPLGLNETVTAGIISAKDRPVTTGSGGDDQSYINAVQTDAAINPGNSGGPLVNLQGQVIGVNSAIASTGSTLGGEAGNIGVGFAIPIEQVITTTDQILRTGEAEYPVIGARVVSTSTRPADDTAGAEIAEVDGGTPAARAGLRKGDVVTELDGDPVADGQSLIVAIRTHVPGETVELTYERGGATRTTQVKLDGQVG